MKRWGLALAVLLAWSSQLHAETPVLLQSGKASLFIYWPKKNQQLVELPIFCNRVELGKMGRGRFMQVLLSPGTHVFEVGKRGMPVEVESSSEARKYFRIDWPKGGWNPVPAFRRPKLLAADEQNAKAEIERLTYIQPEKIKDPSVVSLSADERRRLKSR